MFCQVTENFDSVMALASSPRPANSGKIYFANDETRSTRARSLYDSNTVMYNDNFLQPESLEDFGLTYSDALHIIVAVFQSQPLKMEFLAMKKVLELELEVKPSDLPRELQVKAEKEESLAWLDQLFFANFFLLKVKLIIIN